MLGQEQNAGQAEPSMLGVTLPRSARTVVEGSSCGGRWQLPNGAVLHRPAPDRASPAVGFAVALGRGISGRPKYSCVVEDFGSTRSQVVPSRASAEAPLPSHATWFLAPLARRDQERTVEGRERPGAGGARKGGGEH